MFFAIHYYTRRNLGILVDCSLFVHFLYSKGLSYNPEELDLKSFLLYCPETISEKTLELFPNNLFVVAVN